MTSKRLGYEETATHILTHSEWNGMPEYFSRGSNETGVRRIENGEVVEGSFILIQHGWHDWRSAGTFIKKALAKDWNERRINTVMDFLKDRRNQPPKAMTL